ncbi:MAG: response regulator [Nitrososphaerales archaeon]
MTAAEQQGPEESGPGNKAGGQSLILAVDHNRRNLELLAHFLRQSGYGVITASSADEFGRALDDQDSIALALVDLAGLDRGVWDLCERVRTEGISLLIISPRQSAEVERASLAHGAQGVLIKPLVVKELLALIGRLIEE